MDTRETKKILYYNWVDYENDDGAGGGVNLYQKNLLSYLRDESDLKIYFLSAGQTFNLLSTNIRIEELPRLDGIRRFEIVNSSVFSPAHAAFRQVNAFNHDEKIKNSIRDFFNSHGPFDIFHLNNIEGLSIRVLELKSEFPTTKFIYTLHNYFPFCPQVNLWKNDTEHCLNNNKGADCVNCVKSPSITEVFWHHYIINFLSNKIGLKKWVRIKKNIIGFIKIAYRSYKYLSKSLGRFFIASRANLEDQINAAEYNYFIQNNILYFNKHIDKILAVSNKTLQIAIEKGIKKNKIELCYIGTKFSEHHIPTRGALYSSILSIAYLGYMRRDKGFFFFIDTLLDMPIELSSKLSITVAAKLTDKSFIKKIPELKRKLKSFTYYNGYKHNDLDTILNGIEVGIIPVLWEDNFPQVAMELFSLGISILASDKGGAQELCGSPDLIFRAGDKADLSSKIRNIINNKNILLRDSPFKLIKMHEHISSLRKVYFEYE